MKRWIPILACSMTMIISSARGEETPLSLAFTVQSISAEGGASLLTVSVNVTNQGPTALEDLSIQLLWPPGGAIAGAIQIGPIGAGEMREAAGSFFGPEGFFEQVDLNRVIWQATFTDAQGGPHSQIVTASQVTNP